MTHEIAFVLTGMQDVLSHAGSTAFLVWLFFVLWIGFVLLLDRWGWI